MPTELDFIATLAALRQDYDSVPTYHQLWAAVTSGRVPARRFGRSWRINQADLPAIVAHYNLPKRAA